MAPIQFYYFPFSMNCQKVRIALEEKKLEYLIICIDLIKGENLDPEFMKINSKGTVPVLVNNEKVYSDLPTIIEFIGNLEGNFSKNSLEISKWVQQINTWDAELFTYGNMPRTYSKFMTKYKRRTCTSRMPRNVSLITAYNTRLSYYEAIEQEMQDDAAVNASFSLLVKILDSAENVLSSQEFIAGNEFSMADACFAAVLARVQLIGLTRELIRSRVKLFNYSKRIQCRPSYRRSVGRYSYFYIALFIMMPSFLTAQLKACFGRY